MKHLGCGEEKLEHCFCQPGRRCCYCRKTIAELEEEEIAESIDNHKNEGLSSK